MGGYGRDANGMPVRVSVDGANQIVGSTRKDDAFGATALATARRRRWQYARLPLHVPICQSLSATGTVTAIRSCPLPRATIVKIHLTFAPRFEVRRSRSARGWAAEGRCCSVAADTEEEWQSDGRRTDARGQEVLRRHADGRKKASPASPTSAFSNPTRTIRHLVLPCTRPAAGVGLVDSAGGAWPPGTRIQRISTITGTRSDSSGR
jgi:hypothetical protein